MNRLSYRASPILKTPAYLQAWLGEEGDSTVEKIVPHVVHKVHGEKVSDGVGEVAQRVEDDRVDQHGHLGPVPRVHAVLDQVHKHDQHLERYRVNCDFLFSQTYSKTEYRRLVQDRRKVI